MPPEPRLTYANAVLPEAMIAAGRARTRLCVDAAWSVGLALAFETAHGHLSPTPVAGRGPEDARPGFDQQPIEVSTLADACARAAALDTDPVWRDGVTTAAAWFMGDNDAAEPMWDPDTGGGYDGLQIHGRTVTGARNRLRRFSRPCRRDVYRLGGNDFGAERVGHAGPPPARG